MAWVTCVACQCQHDAGPDRPCPFCGAAPLVAAGASVPVDGVVTFAEPPLPVVPVLRRATAHRCRVSASSACEVCGQPVPAEPLTRRDLIDSAWLRGVARYLRQCQSLEGIQAVLVAEIAQRAERLASDLDWCLGFVDGLEDVRPGAVNEIARLACSEAPAPRIVTGVAPVAAPWAPSSQRSPDGPGDQGKRPIYSAPPGGEWD